MLNKLKDQKAFTLIELLVVIAIVSIISSILFAAIDPKGMSFKADDAKRIAIFNQLQKALELYKLDHGQYPHDGSTSWGIDTYHGNGSFAQRNLENDLRPYINIDFSDDLWGPYWNYSNDGYFLYSVTSENNYQTYGMATNLLSSENSHLERDDGGWTDSFYEVGQNPRYCKEKGLTWSSGDDTVCAGTN